MPRVQFQYSINIAGSASQKWGLAGEKAVLLIDAEWERGGSVRRYWMMWRGRKDSVSSGKSVYRVNLTQFYLK